MTSRVTTPTVETFEAFIDDRGQIRDLLRDSKIDSITYIFTKKGAVRGNHYHSKTSQWTFVMLGRLRVVTKEVMSHRVASRRPSDMTAGVQHSAEAPAGTFFLTPPNEAHAWEALEDTAVLVFTQGPRSGVNYESDTTHLDEDDRLI